MFGRLEYLSYICVKNTQNMSPSVKLFIKIGLMAVLALLMLIPLAMIKSQIQDRQYAMDASAADVAASWAGAQTFGGPVLSVQHAVPFNGDGKPRTEYKERKVHPTTLRYDISADTQNLHRSIYDIMVYRSSVRITGQFLVPAEYVQDKDFTVELDFGDLRGIEGDVTFLLDGQPYSFSGSGESTIAQTVNLDPKKLEGGESFPFELSMKVRGSESVMIHPYGDVTEVTMTSNCLTPSFTGDFLPDERTVDEKGFTAHWSVSRINRGDPATTEFGVRLLKGVTRYQQATRSAKYGILIILLVFIAGLTVEFLTRREINLVQYVVIGLSLALFYALLLSFSEFLSFGKAYMLAAVMTTAALTGYFRGILKHASAWILGGLVAVAYILSFILLQMETYALISGTLILFGILCAIMWFTRNLTRQMPDPEG